MSAPYDPYRYGAPEPVHPSRATGKQILQASWRLLRQDRELLVLPVIGALAALLAAGMLFVPGWFLGRAVDNTARAGAWTGGVLAVFAASVVGIFFEAALVIGANLRADGHPVSLGDALGGAWRLRGQIVGWALVSTTVGVAMRAVEQRLGILGRVLGFLGGLAWTIASFLVVPVIVAEGLGPIAAVKRSAALLRQTWGTGLRTTLRFGLLQALAIFPVTVLLVAGAGIWGSGSTVAGKLMAAIGVVGLVAIITISAAVTTYAHAVIYRYAVGRPVPGIPEGLLGGAFAPRKRRRR